MRDTEADKIATVLRQRIRESDTTQQRLGLALGYSSSWVGQELLGDPKRVMLRLLVSEPGRLAQLARSLGWHDVKAMFDELSIQFPGAELSGHGQARPHGTVTLSDPPDKNGAPADRAEPGVIRGAFDAATARRLNAVVLPVRALAAAGKPIDANDILDEEAIAVEDYRPGLQLYRAEGDSMSTTDPDTSITDGDTVWVDTHDRGLRAGKVYVIAIPGGGSTIKRVRLVRGEPWLFSDNPDHEPFPVEPEFVVVGRVTDSFTRKKH